MPARGAARSGGKDGYSTGTSTYTGGTRAQHAYETALKRAEAERDAEVTAARREAEEEKIAELAAARQQWDEDKQEELASLRRVARAEKAAEVSAARHSAGVEVSRRKAATSPAPKEHVRDSSRVKTPRGSASL